MYIATPLHLSTFNVSSVLIIFPSHWVEASCGCPKYANDVYMNIHNPNPNPNPNPKSLTPP